MDYSNRLCDSSLAALDPLPSRSLYVMERTRPTPRTSWQKKPRRQALPNQLRLHYCKEHQLVQDLFFATAPFINGEHSSRALTLRFLSVVVREHLQQWRRKPDTIDREKVLTVRHMLTRIRYLVGAVADAGELPQGLQAMLLRRLCLFERVILGFIHNNDNGDPCYGQN